LLVAGARALGFATVRGLALGASLLGIGTGLGAVVGMLERGADLGAVVGMLDRGFFSDLFIAPM
jgi:hypothetical protein